MPDGEQEETSGEAAKRNNYLITAVETLDELVADWHDEGYRKAELSAPDLAAEAGVNYNTWHKNGVTPALTAEINSLDYVPWQGFKLVIEDYIEERSDEIGIEVEQNE